MRRTFLIFVCLLVTAPIAAAQVPTGTISGRVVSSDDAPLPGVTVTVTSPSLQGERVAVTTVNGDFVVPLLPPGDYTLVFELSGFRSATRRVGVAGTQSLTLNETMSVSGISETVDVVGRAEAFTDTATVAATFAQTLMTTLPSNRTLDAAVLMGPAVHATGPNGGYSIAGAMSYESLFAVNGVVITENLRGQPLTLYIEDALQETTVATSGISAEFGRFGGGLVNAITKSGSDRFSGSYRQSFNNDAWRTVSPFNEARLDKVVPTYEYTFGGPIARRRLWFFNAGRFQEQQVSFNTVATSIPYVRTNDEKRYEIKGTYSPLSGHTGRVAYSKIDQQVTNFWAGNILDTRSLYNQGQPQDLLSVHYTAVLTSNVSLEGQWAQRTFTFVGAGAPTRDLIEGTLLVDRSRGGTNFRYWSPTFCAVCDNNEERNNTDLILKGSYFLSTRGTGSHHVVAGVDSYNDHRLANNHQSGSDYRILGTSTIVQGTDVLPVFLPSSTIIQWNPITQRSRGTDLRTHSVFLNDQWQYNGHLTFNLGVRWDRNQGEDAVGGTISDSSKWSPRLAVVVDPGGDGVWSASGSFARYVTSLTTSLADTSPGGNASTYQWPYLGPAVNQDPAGPLMTTPQAVQTVFAWFNANGGTSRPFSLVDIPGVSSRIGETLDSPHANEWAAGVSRRIGRGSVRADVVYRDYNDFYAARVDATTGRVTDPIAGTFDLALLENTDVVDRRYKGVTFQATYRLGSRVDVGGTYTLSKASGTFDGENTNSGPVTTELLSYPEFVQARWNSPEGALSIDQRHRSRIWGTYRVPTGDRIGSLDLGVVQTLESGVPYGAVGAVNTIPYAPAGLYLNPSGDRPDGFWNYYFTRRDAFRTAANYRTDLAINYAYRVPGAAGMQVFFRGEVINVFDVFQLCGCGATVFSNGGATRLSAINQGVLTAANSPALRPFDPFTETPVEGVHWAKGPAFGQQVNQQSWTTPRLFRFSLGVRF